MGGVGKTTLAQLVYNDNRVKDSFDCTTWNCVSENFGILSILKTIFEQVTATTCDIQDLNLLQVKITERFGGKKIFVVLDDVWNEKYNVWDHLVRIFRCGAREIKIIVTTRSENVALVVGTLTTHYLKQLSDEECWLLFAKHAFKNGNSHEYPNPKVIGKGIIHKCKGLPLAAKTLGGLLRSKEDPREWEKILKSDMWDLPEGKSDILPALRLSYHYLSSQVAEQYEETSKLTPLGYKRNNIKELGELQHLYGALSIINLQNVQHARDATEVKLKDKQYLSELVFRWSHGTDNSENERIVLEQLHPHTKLESLTIENYGVQDFQIG
ncbi:putative disease resistance protein RGA3 [Quercus lobata]|uniref:putative disease resistance protein RGA3 n=1 Tax=Quercus lobata TaxID=97700 RepID=UPI001248B20D|nr:putative disease resistance protein RGA3 [Quercus lobata]